MQLCGRNRLTLDIDLEKMLLDGEGGHFQILNHFKSSNDTLKEAVTFDRKPLLKYSSFKQVFASLCPILMCSHLIIPNCT